MTDPMTWILGCICVAVISGTVGKYIGGSGKISNIHCGERQRACQSLLLEKIGNVEDKIDSLTKAVNDKVLKP